MEFLAAIQIPKAAYLAFDIATTAVATVLTRVNSLTKINSSYSLQLLRITSGFALHFESSHSLRSAM